MRPARLLLQWLAAWSFLAFVLVFLRNGLAPDAVLLLQIEALWWGLGAGFGLSMILDALRRPQLKAITVHRILPHNVALGVENKACLNIANPFDHPLQMDVTEHVPETLVVPTLPLNIQFGPGECKSVQYPMTPVRRGRIRFGRTALRVNSRLRFWQWLIEAGHESEIRVYPNFSAIARLAPLGFERRVAQMGAHLMPRRDEGLAFHQLREFREGDALRQIDWKASARYAKAISREYQDERDQEMIFLLDCGRRLRNKDDTLSHFDHALNALLLTACIALRHGDAAGMMSFAGAPRWLSPVKGHGGINVLLKQLYDLHSSTENSDFLQAAQQLMQRRRKRALIILISNVREEDREDLISAVRLLKKQHQVVIASLREHFLDACLRKKVCDFDDALRYSGTAAFVAQRTKLLKKLRGEGVVIVDAEPQALHMHLVQAYLRMKRGGGAI